MKDLIILGAGGSGVELVSVIGDINQKEKKWKILGYLDDNPDLHNLNLAGYSVLGKIEDCVNYPKAFYISSIANPKNRRVRELVFMKVKKFALPFATIIHPSAIIYNEVIMGEGTVIKANCVIGANSRIGENVFISNGTIISHETIVEDHATLATGVNVSSGVTIGQGSYIGCGVSTSHDIRIDSDVVIGTGAAVISDVNRGLSDTWVGIPAKPIIIK